MKNCEYCDYYNSIVNDSAENNIKEICTFIDIELKKSREWNSEYPCKNTTYREYLVRKKRIQKEKVDDIKFIYSCANPKLEKVNSKSE